MRALGEEIAAMEVEGRADDEALHEALLAISNTAHTSTPAGSDASSNVLVRSHGDIPTFDFNNEERPPHS
jgi:seryl-tRNA synthetase